MNIGSSVVEIPDVEALDARLDELTSAALLPLAGETPCFGFLTLTYHLLDYAEKIVSQVRKATGVHALIGASAEGVIGSELEVEREPAISLWLADMPEVRVRGFHIHPRDLEVVDSQDELRRLLRAADVEDGNFLLMADPHFTPFVVGLLDAMTQILGGRPVFGGMASGVTGPEKLALILDDDVFREGAVGVVISGNVDLSTVVSQGCRPIGDPFIVTAAERNHIHQLGGRPAIHVLHEVFANASQRDQNLMRQRVFVGRAISEYREDFTSGDFLIRNVEGADEESGALIIGDIARVGTSVQFHVRDPDSADGELRRLLNREKPAAGGLVFSCNGRGTRMYPDKHHDIGVVQNVMGPLPMSGMFCAGEIGPIAGEPFVHGHTASIAMFRPLHD